ncbi:histidine phosphatase superfamily [Paraphysoderma sedebokerense]|nr:histidine phosphatase superfamily [Paraphysoderma sedebokerense]
MHHIYLTRHGARADWDPLYILAHSPTTLLHDPPLSRLGIQQSLELKSYFLSLPSHLRPAHIFSSPYYRCLQTIQPTAEALGIKVKIEQGVSEWHSSPAIVEENGIRRVKRKKHASFKKLQELFSRDVFIDWSYESLVKLNVESEVDDDIEIVAEDLKMETKEQLYQRVGLTLQKLVQEGYTKDGPILIVSHAATLIMMGNMCFL